MNSELPVWLPNVAVMLNISNLNQEYIRNTPTGQSQLQRDNPGMERIKLLVGNINPFLNQINR